MLDVAYYGVYETKSIIESIFNKLLENICYIGLALIACTQFQLERKHQFYFRLTLICQNSRTSPYLHLSITDSLFGPRETNVPLNIPL